MKLDLIIYGRGQERLDGYQLFAAPDYWSDEMLYAMGSFNELWNESDLRNIANEPLLAAKKPWEKTFMFVYMNEPYCCTFLRCIRVEGDQEGTWLKDFSNRDIWSMEGVCCPVHQREEFFAMLPSIILWFEQDSSSLYKRFKEGRIGKSIEIPENIMYNPYTITSGYPFENSSVNLEQLIKDEKSRNKWIDLCNKICFSSQPFYFLYGPLADDFARKIGATYGISEVFSTISDKSSEIENDPFSKMKVISRRKNSVKRISYNLAFSVNSDKNNSLSYKWHIICTDPKYQNENIESQSYSLVNNRLIDLKNLRAQAETIRDFAKRIKLNVTDDNAKETERYTFEREE